MSGDARRCLDICRRAVDIAGAQNTKPARGKATRVLVEMKHVTIALEEMFSSPKIIAMR